MTQQLHTVAIDLAKKVFHLVGADTTGKILWRKRLTRYALMPFIAQLPPVLIGIETCGGAHDWARRFRAHGHEVKLMAPQFVKPFVKSNKNGHCQLIDEPIQPPHDVAYSSLNIGSS
jgi:transposase